MPLSVHLWDRKKAKVTGCFSWNIHPLSYLLCIPQKPLKVCSFPLCFTNHDIGCSIEWDWTFFLNQIRISNKTMFGEHHPLSQSNQGKFSALNHPKLPVLLEEHANSSQKDSQSKWDSVKLVISLCPIFVKSSFCFVPLQFDLVLLWVVK